MVPVTASAALEMNMLSWEEKWVCRAVVMVDGQVGEKMFASMPMILGGTVVVVGELASGWDDWLWDCDCFRF